MAEAEVPEEKLEEEVEQMLRKMTQGKWTDMIKQIISQVEAESIKKCKGNKLCKAKILSHLLMAIDKSLKGWGEWMNFDKMDELSEEEIDWIYPRLKKIVIDWLKLDIAVTEKKEEEAIRRNKEEVVKKIIKTRMEQEKKKKKKGKGTKPKFYVS